MRLVLLLVAAAVLAAAASAERLTARQRLALRMASRQPYYNNAGTVDPSKLTMKPKNLVSPLVLEDDGMGNGDDQDHSLDGAIINGKVPNKAVGRHYVLPLDVNDPAVQNAKFTVHPRNAEDIDRIIRKYESSEFNTTTEQTPDNQDDKDATLRIVEAAREEAQKVLASSNDTCACEQTCEQQQQQQQQQQETVEANSCNCECSKAEGESVDSNNTFTSTSSTDTQEPEQQAVESQSCENNSTWEGCEHHTVTTSSSSSSASSNDPSIMEKLDNIEQAVQDIKEFLEKQPEEREEELEEVAKKAAEDMEEGVANHIEEKLKNDLAADQRELAKEAALEALKLAGLHHGAADDGDHNEPPDDEKELIENDAVDEAVKEAEDDKAEAEKLGKAFDFENELHDAAKRSAEKIADKTEALTRHGQKPAQYARERKAALGEVDEAVRTSVTSAEEHGAGKASAEVTRDAASQAAKMVEKRLSEAEKQEEDHPEDDDEKDSSSDVEKAAENAAKKAVESVIPELADKVLDSIKDNVTAIAKDAVAESIAAKNDSSSSHKDEDEVDSIKGGDAAEKAKESAESAIGAADRALGDDVADKLEDMSVEELAKLLNKKPAHRAKLMAALDKAKAAELRFREVLPQIQEVQHEEEAW